MAMKWLGLLDGPTQSLPLRSLVEPTLCSRIGIPQRGGGRKRVPSRTSEGRCTCLVLLLCLCNTGTCTESMHLCLNRYMDTVQFSSLPTLAQVAIIAVAATNGLPYIAVVCPVPLMPPLACISMHSFVPDVVSCQTPGVADYHGASIAWDGGVGQEACGSPDEIRNDPTLGNWLPLSLLLGSALPEPRTFVGSTWHQRSISRARAPSWMGLWI